MEACLRTGVTTMHQPLKPAPVKSPASKAGVRRGNRRRRAEPGDQMVRYFVGRPAGDDGKPMLEQEVASEPEGLVIAFKNDSRVYFVHEYRVTQRIEGNEVRLEKEPVSSAKRVSTANAS
ncbi:MAG: hypothetical protein M9913_03510 [Bryobacteraceae bacterium]|nr:hypothetical protein [Bryobacteraceae bacterium]